MTDANETGRWSRGTAGADLGAALREAGVLSTIGHTPLIQLTRAAPHLPFQVFAKLEGFNPGGSSKDRAALWMLTEAIARGDVTSQTTIIESSSGNMAIGLAQVCRYYNLRFICVVDAKTTAQNVALLRAYEAQVDIVETPDASGDLLTTRIRRVQALTRAIPNAYWPNQYANTDNPKAHFQTMAEIAAALDHRVDHLFCSTSSCGTIRGCAEYVRAHGMATRVWAVDAVGSVIFGDAPGKRLLPGHGAARRPELLRLELVDDCVHVTDLDCVMACRRLLVTEALLVGGSSGGVFAAIEARRGHIGEGQTCVAIFPDRGERYIDTIYSDAWVGDHFDEVPIVRHAAHTADVLGA